METKEHCPEFPVRDDEPDRFFLSRLLDDFLLEMAQEEAKREGARSCLLEMLQYKFGELPEHIQARVKAGHDDELQHWGSRLVDQYSLDDIFAA